MLKRLFAKHTRQLAEYTLDFLRFWIWYGLPPNHRSARRRVWFVLGDWGMARYNAYTWVATDEEGDAVVAKIDFETSIGEYLAKRFGLYPAEGEYFKPGDDTPRCDIPVTQ